MKLLKKVPQPFRFLLWIPVFPIWFLWQVYRFVLTLTFIAFILLVALISLYIFWQPARGFINSHVPSAVVIRKENPAKDKVTEEIDELRALHFESKPGDVIDYRGQSVTYDWLSARLAEKRQELEVIKLNKELDDLIKKIGGKK